MSLAEETTPRDAKVERRLRIACMFALVALALIAFSLLVPKPLPVIVAMSVAQGIGTLSLLVFLHIVSKDVWKFMSGKSSAPAKADSEIRPPPS